MERGMGTVFRTKRIVCVEVQVKPREGEVQADGGFILGAL